MWKPAPRLLCMILLVIAIARKQAEAHTPDTHDDDDATPRVSLSATTSFKSDLQCYTELICRVGGGEDGLRRLVNIVISDKTNSKELKKVSSIYHFTSGISKSNGADKVETPDGVTVENGTVVLQASVPYNEDGPGRHFVCKLRYFDSDFSMKSVQDEEVEKISDKACKKPALLNKLGQIGDKLSKLSEKFDDQLNKLSEKFEGKLNKLSEKIEGKLPEMETNLVEVMTDVSDLKNHFGPNFNDCDSLRSQRKSLSTPSRQIVTWPDGTKVLCDTQTSGGGWTVFQRRVDGTVDFYRGWKEYENGFGNLDGDFWLGLKPLQRLVESGEYELRVDMSFNGSNYYALYSQFKLSPPSTNYKLTVGGYFGTAGDSFAHYHNSCPFSTFDKDNDHYRYNCAMNYHGAWWYNACFRSNLNALFGSTIKYKGMIWNKLTGYSKSVTRSEMKVRRKKGNN